MKVLMRAEISGLAVEPPKESGAAPRLKLTLRAGLQDDVFAELAQMMKTPWVMVWFEGLQGQLIPVDRETGEVLEAQG